MPNLILLSAIANIFAKNKGSEKGLVILFSLGHFEIIFILAQKLKVIKVRLSIIQVEKINLH